jgi:hypothetical protein
MTRARAFPADATPHPRENGSIKGVAFCPEGHIVLIVGDNRDRPEIGVHLDQAAAREVIELLQLMLARRRQ